MGVWIETVELLANLEIFWVTPFVGVWIETPASSYKERRVASHTLRGCVDWNKLLVKLMPLIWVTPFVGVWIETEMSEFTEFVSSVTPFVGVWIETPQSFI